MDEQAPIVQDWYNLFFSLVTQLISFSQTQWISPWVYKNFLSKDKYRCWYYDQRLIITPLDTKKKRIHDTCFKLINLQLIPFFIDCHLLQSSFPFQNLSNITRCKPILMSPCINYSKTSSFALILIQGLGNGYNSDCKVILPNFYLLGPQGSPILHLKTLQDKGSIHESSNLNIVGHKLSQLIVLSRRGILLKKWGWDSSKINILLGYGWAR